MTKSTKPFGAFLRELREANKLTLRQMEEKTGISNAYISQVENGQIKRPSPNFLHKISEALNYPYEGLLDRAGHIVPKAPSANKVPKKRESGEHAKAFAIFSSIKDVTEEEAEVLLEFLNWRRSRQSRKAK